MRTQPPAHEIYADISVQCVLHRKIWIFDSLFMIVILEHRWCMVNSTASSEYELECTFVLILHRNRIFSLMPHFIKYSNMLVLNMNYLKISRIVSHLVFGIEHWTSNVSCIRINWYTVGACLVRVASKQRKNDASFLDFIVLYMSCVFQSSCRYIYLYYIRYQPAVKPCREKKITVPGGRTDVSVCSVVVGNTYSPNVYETEYI